jgi:murein DD-endopeptidase MepM/ murein hydrolase activator NlpD
MSFAPLVLMLMVVTTALPAGIVRSGFTGGAGPPSHATALSRAALPPLPRIGPRDAVQRPTSSHTGPGVEFEAAARRRGRSSAFDSTVLRPVPAGGAAESLPPFPADGGYVWPLDGVPPVLRRFDPPPQPWLPGHRGVDLGAGPGSAVRAAGDGTVVFAGMVAGRGVVSVEHAGGLRTTYQPVHLGVATGHAVTAGAPLGTLAVGHDGCPASACLHWGLRRDGDYLDPLLLLALGRARLLPAAAGP